MKPSRSMPRRQLRIALLRLLRLELETVPMLRHDQGHPLGDGAIRRGVNCLLEVSKARPKLMRRMIPRLQVARNALRQ